MGNAKITFPITANNVRRNAETGVEIRTWKTASGMEYSVYAPMLSSQGRLQLINYFDTLAGAREEALDRAQELRDQIAEAHGQAITEDIEREARAIAASIPIDGRPAEVTKLLEAAELLNDERENLAALRHAREVYDELVVEVRLGEVKDYDRALAIRDAIPAILRTGEVLTEIGRSMNSLRPADALRHAERARDLAAAHAPQTPADNEKRVLLGMLSAACSYPGAFRAWADRHNLTGWLGKSTWTVEQLYAAHEADHADALQVNAWIDDNRDICV
jgi:hypothetical protein